MNRRRFLLGALAAPVATIVPLPELATASTAAPALDLPTWYADYDRFIDLLGIFTNAEASPVTGENPPAEWWRLLLTDDD